MSEWDFEGWVDKRYPGATMYDVGKRTVAEEFRPLIEAAREIVDSCEVSGPTYMDPPEYVPPQLSDVLALSKVLRDLGVIDE